METPTPDLKLPETEASFNLRLTATESEEVAQLLDMAVKAGGIRVAPLALKYMTRIQNGLKSAIVPAAAIPPSVRR